MSGISTSVGPFSGIDSGALIQQLLALDARPKQLAQFRVNQLQTQRAALLDINSTLLALKTASSNLRQNKIFKSAKATSSDETILTATASTSASPGAYKLSVARLVSAQQQISRGFTDRDTTGIQATNVTIETGGGRLDSDTALASLNGGEGVSRGKIRIFDRAGASAVIDLSTSVTVSDVLTAINTNGAAAVTASVSGDRLVLSDTSAGAGTLRVENVAGYTTATSLGIFGNGVGATLTGTQVNSITGVTALTALNDGTGVAIRADLPLLSPDFKITSRDGVTVLNVELGKREHTVPGTPPVVVVDQTAATTLQQVVDRINATAGNGGKVVASIDSVNNRLVLTDTTGGVGNFKVEEATVGDSTRTTARDLGILADVASAGINGRRLVSTINSTLSSSLKGGLGVGAGQFTITKRDATLLTIDVAADDSIATIIDSINNAVGNGGTVVAALNRAGNGVTLTDSTTGANTIIADVTGTAAAALGIATAGASTGVVNSGNLQTRWISRATKLADLNQKAGLGTGTLRLTDSAGIARNVIVDDTVKTVDDLLRKINNGSSTLTARINDNGDGILFEDASGAGTQKIKIEDSAGSIAKRLNAAKTSDSGVQGSNQVNGTYERSVTLLATDTLDQVASKFNADGGPVLATVISDGSSASPFRLTFTSKATGAIGRAIVDFTGANLDITTLTRGSDAVAFFGALDPAQGVLLSSNTNNLDNAITGVTIDLLKASTTSVEVVVTRDSGAIEGGIDGIVSAFNTILDKLAKYDAYDTETKKQGPLLGDISVATVRSGIFRIVQGVPLNVSGRYQRLTDAGVTVGTGGKLKFDKTRFRDAYTTDPQGMEDLFSAFVQQAATNTTGPNGEPLPQGAFTTSPAAQPVYTTLGVAEQLSQLAAGLTNSVDGLLSRRDKALASEIDSQNDRIANFDLGLARKQAKYEAQFRAMEQAIASLKTQQNALGSLGIR